MSGRFEQLVALVTYANVSLQNEEIQFDLGQATTEYCPRLEFIKKPPEGMAGATVYIAPNAEPNTDKIMGYITVLTVEYFSKQ